MRNVSPFCFLMYILLRDQTESVVTSFFIFFAREHNCVCHDARDHSQPSTPLLTVRDFYYLRICHAADVRRIIVHTRSYKPASAEQRADQYPCTPVARLLNHSVRWIRRPSQLPPRRKQEEEMRNPCRSIARRATPTSRRIHYQSTLRAGSKATKLITVCGNAERKLRRGRLRFINPP